MIMTRKYDRTVEDTLKMITHAKHSEDELVPITQVFYYPSKDQSTGAKENMKLIDLEEELIQKIEDGERLIFKGSKDEKLVLCTENETYEIKEGEISNSLVICPDLRYTKDVKKHANEQHSIEEQQIYGIFNSYLELRPTFPRLHKLRKILSHTAYKGEELEDEEKSKGYYLSELLDTIQCSRTELLLNLQHLGACCIDDKWRLIDLEYQTRVLSFIFNLMEEKNWSNVHTQDCRRILRSLVPSFIMDHTLLHFAEPADESGDVLVFKEDIVCRCFAEMLLRAGEGKFRYNEFTMAWKQCLPPGMNVDLKYLRGLALIEDEGLHQQVIHLFPEYSLPENVGERFRLLFKRKEKWTIDEIQPYIETLATKTMNVNSMLTKFSRASNLNGVRVFGARHAQ